MEVAEQNEEAWLLKEAARKQALILEEYGSASVSSKMLLASTMKSVSGELPGGMAEEVVGDWSTVGRGGKVVSSERKSGNVAGQEGSREGAVPLPEGRRSSAESSKSARKAGNLPTVCGKKETPEKR